VPLIPLGLADVVGDSMSPTLLPGDRLLVRWGAPVRPGDVVVLHRPDRPRLVVVKRAVRLVPGGWWVLGDNPARSDDSRLFGPAPPAAIIARSLLHLPRRRRRHP
jgi:nickel-type superoxide dismutase maturation protease